MTRMGRQFSSIDWHRAWPPCIVRRDSVVTNQPQPPWRCPVVAGLRGRGAAASRGITPEEAAGLRAELLSVDAVR